VRTSGRAQVRKRKDVRTDVDDQNLGNGWVDPRESFRWIARLKVRSQSARTVLNAHDRMGSPAEDALTIHETVRAPLAV
jgi:hypothetical protein